VTVLGHLSAAACAGRSESRGPHESSGGSSGVGGGLAGRSTGGAGSGATGGTKTGIGGDIIYEGGGRNTTGGVGSGGGGRGGNGAMGGGGGDAGADSGFPCVGGSRLSPDLVGCEHHFAHRPEAATCPPPPPFLQTGAAGDGAGGQGGEGGATSACGPEVCARGESCIWTDISENARYECARVCRTDAECPSGSICSCVPGLFLEWDEPGPGTTVGLCRRATCASDAECGPGLLCIASFSYADCGSKWPHEFHCQTPRDECASPDDCALEDCEYQSEHFACGDSTEFC
jgi:hypothetical protein